MTMKFNRHDGSYYCLMKVLYDYDCSFFRLIGSNSIFHFRILPEILRFRNYVWL